MGKKSLISLLTAWLFVVGGVIYGSVSFAHEPDDPPPSGNLEPLADLIEQGDVSIKLETVATGLTAPNWGTVAPDDDERLFVTDQPGTLWAIDLDTGDKTVFLDVTDRIGLLPRRDPGGTLGTGLGIRGPGTFDERGLLGVAFHPDYEENGLLYTYTNESARDSDGGLIDTTFPPTVPPGEVADSPPAGRAVPDNHAVITEWTVFDPDDPTSLPGSPRELMRIEEPQFNHDGGGVSFGPDEMLYVSLGDGGAGDDQGVGHVDGGNGQDPSNVLGSVLRIDPTGSNSANGQYGIPSDNPFVGEEDFVDEIFAYGFRNPFRFSFDMERGDLYLGDVGQNDIEEVDVVVRGGNYGWRLKEGSFFFDPDGTGPTCNRAPRGCASEDDPGGLPLGLIDPIAEYDTHTDGHSVIGGFVYRGDEIESLAGRYVFGDYAKPLDVGGRLFFLAKKNVVRKNNTKESKILEFQLAGLDELGLFVLGFGQDAAGELYVMANDTGVPFGDTGVVLRITPDDEDEDDDEDEQEDEDDEDDD